MTTHVLFALVLSVSHMSAVDIQHRFDRLQMLGSALYVAAHPDDENTQLLTYLTHERGARTAYLSLTRGDGGQNLIGSEQSPLMGVIRTHELLEARSRDGAEQLFSRARDFGYSKSAEETLEVWGKEATLADAVWAIRTFRPDIVIARFPEQGNTHGHHLASAIIAREAFVAAADPARFPDQLKRTTPWQATRLVFNVPDRFMPDEARPDDLVIDIGGYDAASGLSYGEIAALSRSMHKSQGFGAARRFGPEPERFRHLAGQRAERDLFDGVVTSWADVEAGPAVASALDAARRAFTPDHPGRAAPDLVRALRAASELSDSAHKRWAMRELSSLLVGVSGLLLEARAEKASAFPGETLDATVTVLARSDVPVKWVSLRAGEALVDVAADLQANAPIDKKVSIQLEQSAALSTMPWLEETPRGGRYVGRGDPSTPLDDPKVAVELLLDIAGARLSVTLPVRHHWVDSVIGERQRDVEILPPLTATPEAKALTLPCAANARKPCSSKLRVGVVARQPGKIRVETPQGFSASPSEFDVTRDGEHVVTITGERNPDGTLPSGTLRFVAQRGESSWSLSEHLMDHSHVPLRTVLLPAEVTLGMVELSVPTGRIGHIAGPGDEVADGLRRAGFDITDLDDKAIVHGDLDAYQAILIGARAFNTRDALRKSAARLYAFAERGGTVVSQYVTKPRTEDFDVPLLPYSMQLGRGRVTVETAKVERLVPDHPVLQTPHVITDDDFEGWVQERGLYFGEKWDEQHVVAVLAMADPNEPPERGALLVADHGRGRVAYVGLSLFRQLPAGVPGAYRLLANLLAPRSSAAPAAEEPPPLLGTWNRLYVLVGGVLAFVILALYLLRRRYGS
jgi:LmbE family N-acetylglucosaminyl deacetylase